MLQDYTCGLVEFHDKIQRRIRDRDVIVGQFLSPELLSCGDGRLVNGQIAVEGRFLVRILTVAHDLFALVLNRIGQRKFTLLHIDALEII